MIEAISLLSVLHGILLWGRRWGRRRQLVHWSVHRRSLLHRWEVIWRETMGWWMVGGFGRMIVFICSALLLYSSLIFDASLIIHAPLLLTAGF
jgi:hypothetical protein